MPRPDRPADGGMTRLAALAGCVVFAMSAGPAQGQRRPDFSGVWAVSADPAVTGVGGRSTGSLGNGWGRKFIIHQDRTGLDVEWAIFSRGDLQPPLRLRYELDGTETVNTVWMGRGRQELRSRVGWRGDTLVITTRSAFEHPRDGRRLESRVVRTLWLQPGPLPQWPPSLVIETERSAALGGPPSKARAVYVQSR